MSPDAQATEGSAHAPCHRGDCRDDFHGFHLCGKVGSVPGVLWKLSFYLLICLPLQALQSFGRDDKFWILAELDTKMQILDFRILEKRDMREKRQLLILRGILDKWQTRWTQNASKIKNNLERDVWRRIILARLRARHGKNGWVRARSGAIIIIIKVIQKQCEVK